MFVAFEKKKSLFLIKYEEIVFEINQIWIIIVIMLNPVFFNKTNLNFKLPVDGWRINWKKFFRFFLFILTNKTLNMKCKKQEEIDIKSQTCSVLKSTNDRYNFIEVCFLCFGCGWGNWTFLLE